MPDPVPSRGVPAADNLRLAIASKFPQQKMMAAADLLDAIDALHQPVPIEAVAMKCYNGDCDHQDECPEILIMVCKECVSHTECVTDEWFPAEVEHPCATARLLHPEEHQ